MIVAQVKVTDGLTQPLERFGAAAPGMLDQVLRGGGYRYRAFLRKNYLRGQMLRQNFGDLIRSLYVGKKKGQKHFYLVGGRAVSVAKDSDGFKIYDATPIRLANIFEHAGGYTIVPKKKKRLFAVTASGYWMFATKIQGRERPFMSASAEAFDWGSAFDAELEKALGKELSKAGLGGVA